MPDGVPRNSLFNPLDPAFHANPCPVYARMRAEDPVHWCALGAGFWAVTRYDDIARLLADGRLGMGSWSETKSRQLGFGAAAETVRHWMLLQDPPDHTRLRRLVSQAFTAKAVERMGPRIAAIVDDLLAEPRERRTIDVMADLAFPLPVYVIAEMLGIPTEDRHRFQAWTQAVNLVFEAFLTPEQTTRCHEAARDLGGYLRVLAAERRRAPRGDLMTALIAAQDAEGRLSEEELIGNAGMLLAAGFETTMGAHRKRRARARRVPPGARKVTSRSWAAWERGRRVPALRLAGAVHGTVGTRRLRAPRP
jgi:cytochrome P450